MSKFLKLPYNFKINLACCIILLNISFQGTWATVSCGGILETNAGTLKYGGKDGTADGNCLWIIKLPSTPANSLSIRFELEKIPPTGRLSLYPQDEYVAGQFTILPIGLSSANESSVIETSGSTMIVVWHAGQSAEETLPLIFNWDSINDRQINKIASETRLLGGVGYADSSVGSFSWKKPGEYQDSVLWVLNSKSGNLMDLQTEMEFERCDLADRCLCSYFGVYEVTENSLEAVTTNCGRSSNLTFAGVQSTLVVLAFVNPGIRRDSNYITLTWESSHSDVTTTTTEKTTLTTENVETTSTVTPPIANLCPEAEKISPCTCDEFEIVCNGSSIVQESVIQLMAELRNVNGVAPDKILYTSKFLKINSTLMTSFDLTPLFNSHFSQLGIFENPNLSRIHGPLSPPFGFNVTGPLSHDDPAKNQYFASIETTYLGLFRNNLTDAGLADCFYYFSPSLEILSIGENPIEGPSAVNTKKSQGTEFLPGISNFVNLETLWFQGNSVQLLEGAPFKALRSLSWLDFNCMGDFGEDALLIDEDAANSPYERDFWIRDCATLSDDNFHVNPGLERWRGKTTLLLKDNNFEFLSQEKWESFLQINEENRLELQGNPFVCDQRMKWLKDGRESYERRVLDVKCTNDPGYTIFNTTLV